MCYVIVLIFHHTYPNPINYHELAREQQRDHEISDYETSITSFQWEKIQINNNTVLCYISTGRPIPVVPVEPHRTVCDVGHELPHPSLN